MPRIKGLSFDIMPAELAQRLNEIFGPDRTKGTVTGTPGNWWTVWARVPGILGAFSAYPLRDAPLNAELREIALVRTGYLRASQFVFSQHSKSARKAGVVEEKIKAIPYWTVSDVFDKQERAVLAYTDGLILEDGRIHDAVFASLRAHLSDDEILILTYAVNMYSLHATATRALRLEYDDVPERVVEIPAPVSPGVQDWLRTSWARSEADEGPG